MLKKYYDSFIQYNKRHFSENKKIIFVNLGIFLSLVISLILIDQMTKTFLFDGGMVEGELVSNNQIGNNYVLFGIRSIANPGVTFFGTFFPTWVLHFFSIIIFIICGIFAIYSHDKLLIIAIAFTFSGTFGNFLDRAMFNGYVKDIIFLPWTQTLGNFLSGTFNFADTWLFCGSIISIVYIIIILIRTYKHNKI